MSTAGRIAEASVPVVLELVSHITKLVNAGDDEDQQREALYLIAEATKARLDRLKFPNEPQG
jgi:hypothetical protein